MIKGFRTLDIPIYSDSGSGARHYIYLKEHVEKKHREEGDMPKGCKILFVGNVDYRQDMSDVDVDRYLTLIFSRFGEVQSTYVSRLEKFATVNSRFAHIHFSKASAVAAALHAPSAIYSEAFDEIRSIYGIKSLSSSLKSVSELKRLYSFIDEDHTELQEEVDLFMQNFEEKETLAFADREKKLSEVDEDGFMPIKQR